MEVYKIRNAIRHFTGTTEYNKHLFPGRSLIYLTDGCMFVREECGTNCLFDEILIAQSNRKLERVGFQKWIFTQVMGDLSWKLSCTNTDNNKVVWSKKIDFSDFLLQIRSY